MKLFRRLHRASGSAGCPLQCLYSLPWVHIDDRSDDPDTEGADQAGSLLSVSRSQERQHFTLTIGANVPEKKTS